MTSDTASATEPRLADDLAAARADAWQEHLRRCADSDPYTDGVTTEQLSDRIEQLRQEAATENRSRG